MRAASESQLGQSGLQVFDDLGGDDVRARKIGAVFEAFVFEPEVCSMKSSTLSYFAIRYICCVDTQITLLTAQI
jgi:hypothetical protein